MTDPNTAAGIEALSVAIAIIFEDTHNDAIMRLPTDAHEADRTIARLRQAGMDAVVLANAMAVLIRRDRDSDR
jgi:hypothetical protein